MEKNTELLPKLNIINPIVDIGNITIDLRKIERVGKVYGDQSYLRYNIYFVSGKTIEIYDDRVDDTQMKRETFVELWKSYYDYNE